MPRGSVRRRGASWSITYDLPPVDGKRRQKSTGGFPSKKAAQTALSKALLEVEQGVAGTAQTVGEFLAAWFPVYAPRHLTAGGKEVYERTIRLHLAPGLGSVRLEKLSPLQVERYYAGKLERLKPKTLELHHYVLNAALEDAVKWGLLLRNPLDRVDAPRPGKAAFEVLTARQAVQLLTAAEPTYLHVPLVLAITTGMRRGEVLGLRWQDVDLDAGTAQVRQQVARRGAGWKIDGLKTDASRRPLELLPLAVDALRRHRERQAAWRAQVPGWTDHDLITPDERGGPLNPNRLYYVYHRLLADLGLPRVRWHDLRHTNASLLNQAGVGIKAISERLGHANSSITLNLYAHVMPGMQRDASERLQKLLDEGKDP